MLVLVMDGWRPGLNKVALDKLLQAKTGLSLAVAKTQVDRLLDGEEVGILIPESEVAEELAADATELGASAHIIRVEVGAKT